MPTRAVSRFVAGFASVLLVGLAVAAPGYASAAKAPLASPERFVQLCTSRLALSEQQRSSLRTYLEQEIAYMAVQKANHSAAEVAALMPAEREQLQQVASHLLSPGQLQQFRALETTPTVQEYLRQMDLAK